MSAEDAEKAIDEAINDHLSDVGPRRMEELLQHRAQDMRELDEAGPANIGGSPTVDRVEGDAETLGPGSVDGGSEDTAPNGDEDEDDDIDGSLEA